MPYLNTFSNLKIIFLLAVSIISYSIYFSREVVGPLRRKICHSFFIVSLLLKIVFLTNDMYGISFKNRKHAQPSKRMLYKLPYTYI